MSPNAKKPRSSDNLSNSDAIFDDESLSPFKDLYERLKPTPDNRTIYVSRHGESQYNLEDRIGGNPDLSKRGFDYARALGAHVNDSGIPLEKLVVWTSELRRTRQTAQHVKAPKMARSPLNELDSGLFDDLTYAEFEKRYPEEFARRARDKLRYRYPEGESYIDVCARLESVLPELDATTEPILVVAHQAVIRCVVAFLLKAPAGDLPYIKVPLHCVLKVTFDAEEDINRIEYHHLPVEAVDTYKPRVTGQ